ncbi:MAG TPA: MBL fold metallo-hydrolase [Chloroflexota bacterium]|nr:MBL fold metallo-hydrolase [Chloroflexota bacterium]
MQLDITILGTGTSHGIPVIGCECPVCNSTDPRNHRYRCSALLRYQGRSVLIDTATELRLQAIRAGMRDLDALLFTHSHADHVGGLDDVRVFSERRGAPIPVFGDQACLEDIRRRFAYIFTETLQRGGGKPRLELTPIRGPFDLLGLPVQPVPVFHGLLPVLGYRFGPLAYVTDCNRIPRESMGMLRGLDVLVLDALRHRPHSTHFTVAEALGVIEDLRPARAYLTHMTHDLDHEATNAELPPGVELAYDGLSLEVDV